MRCGRTGRWGVVACMKEGKGKRMTYGVQRVWVCVREGGREEGVREKQKRKEERPLGGARRKGHKVWISAILQ